MLLARSVLFSLLIHLSLFALLVGGGGGEGDGSGQYKNDLQPISIQIQEKDKIEEEPKDGTILVKQIKKKKKKKIKEPDCKDYYTGIGIQTESFATCVVSEVYVGYPAYLNGVMVGDLIISPSCYDIIGPDGSTINLTIMRGSKAIHLSFKRGKICGTR